MRTLSDFELKFVTGAGGSCCDPFGKTRNNNGYGNGPERPAPGQFGRAQPAADRLEQRPQGPALGARRAFRQRIGQSGEGGAPVP